MNVEIIPCFAPIRTVTSLSSNFDGEYMLPAPLPGSK